MRRPTCGSPSENSSSTRESEQQSSSKSLEQSSCKSRKHDRSEEKSEAMFTALDDADLKLTSKLPEYILKKIRSLDGVCFYHGLAARDLVETKLTRAGDYLIRATDNRTSDFEFILSFYNKKRIHSHLTIRADPDDKKWSLGILKDSLKFDKIIDLINHYKTHPLGIGFFLKRGISKGKHLICHDRISYNTKKDLLGSGNFSDVFRGKMELDNYSVKVAMKNSKKLDEMLDESKNNEANKVKKGDDSGSRIHESPTSCQYHCELPAIEYLFFLSSNSAMEALWNNI